MKLTIQPTRDQAVRLGGVPSWHPTVTISHDCDDMGIGDIVDMFRSLLLSMGYARETIDQYFDPNNEQAEMIESYSGIIERLSKELKANAEVAETIDSICTRHDIPAGPLDTRVGILGKLLDTLKSRSGQPR